MQTQFGWHVIKVEDKRVKPPPTFDAVKAQIEKFVVRKAQAELVKKLRDRGQDREVLQDRGRDEEGRAGEKGCPGEDGNAGEEVATANSE